MNDIFNSRIINISSFDPVIGCIIENILPFLDNNIYEEDADQYGFYGDTTLPYYALFYNPILNRKVGFFACLKDIKNLASQNNSINLSVF